MKREVERDKKLPSFAITIEELEILWEKLHSLFDSNNTKKLYTSIDIKLPSESLSFDSVNELKEYKSLPDEIKNFSLRLSNNEKRISIRSSGFGLSPSEYTIDTNAENEAWCAGAIETAYSFLNAHKRWHSWLKHGFTWWFFYTLVVLLPIIFKSFFSNDFLDTTKIDWLRWISLFTIGCLYCFKSKLFPAAVLRIKKDEKFLHRYFTEITIGIGVLTLIATVISIVK